MVILIVNFRDPLDTCVKTPLGKSVKNFLDFSKTFTLWVEWIQRRSILDRKMRRKQAEC